MGKGRRHRQTAPRRSSQQAFSQKKGFDGVFERCGVFANSVSESRQTDRLPAELAAEDAQETAIQRVQASFVNPKYLQCSQRYVVRQRGAPLHLGDVTDPT